MAGLIDHSIDREFKCDYNSCGKYYTKLKYLRHHYRTIHQNIKPNKCDVDNCGKQFATKTELLRHQRKHSEIKPFKCDVNEWLLLIHQLTHSSIKQFECNKCNKTFKSKSYLDCHKRSKHLNVKYVCDYNDCGKCFTSNTYLKQHKSCVHFNKKHHYRTFHLSIKPYKCDVDNCGKQFPTKSNLFDIGQQHVPELQAAGVHVVLIPTGAVYRNAADFELYYRIRRFIEQPRKNPETSKTILVVITGDQDFGSALDLAKQSGISVVLIHRENVSYPEGNCIPDDMSVVNYKHEHGYSRIVGVTRLCRGTRGSARPLSHTPRNRPG
ncbi:zinc finger protein 782-like [Oppia nitens]|uniref:zinc finger protein 782-like n=1 Tax=Oppia nitens TaxID=1686743 RepID=UPI0023DB78D2|nr:zinc finger protein 782-like [Oppia nitens]